MLNEPNRKGLLLVISSPSGGGKTSIYEALLALGEPFAFSVSATTRPQRKGESDGVHYSFVSEEEFDYLVENNMLAEWATVHGHRYGTPKSFVARALDEGKVMIFEIDVQGAAQLKAAYPDDAVLVFILAPSVAETERRLRARGTNEEDDIRLRLRNAIEEVKNAQKYDYIVFNDDLDEAVRDVLSIVAAERLATKRFCGVLWEDALDNIK